MITHIKLSLIHFALVAVLATSALLHGGEALSISSAHKATMLNEDHINQQVVVQGNITSIKQSTGGTDPLFLYLTPTDGTKPVIVGYLPQQFKTFHGELGIPKVGTQIVVRGKVWDYMNTYLIKPEALADVMINGYPHTYQSPEQVISLVSNKPAAGFVTEEKSAAVTTEPKTPQLLKPEVLSITIEDFDQFPTMIDREVTFTGTITEFKPYWSPKAPNIIYVGAGSNVLEIVYWDTEGKLAENLRSPGQQINVQGKLQTYRGKLQIKVGDLQNISSSSTP